MLEDDGVGVQGEADLAQLLHLARAEERRRVGGVATLHDARDDVGAGGVDEQRQLVELVIELLLGARRETGRRRGRSSRGTCDR